jgi:hypothetical protein
MERDNPPKREATQDASGDIAAPKRREFVRRLAEAGVTLPVAAIIYNASTTVAHAS